MPARSEGPSRRIEPHARQRPRAVSCSRLLDQQRLALRASVPNSPEAPDSRQHHERDTVTKDLRKRVRPERLRSGPRNGRPTPRTKRAPDLSGGALSGRTAGSAPRCVRGGRVRGAWSRRRRRTRTEPHLLQPTATNAQLLPSPRQEIRRCCLTKRVVSGVRSIPDTSC